MLTFETMQPMLVEPLPILQLCLSGKVPPMYAHIKLDISNCQSNITMWPEFYNEAAAGLWLLGIPYYHNL